MLEPAHFRFWPPHLPRQLPLPQTSLYGNLEAAAARFGDKAAVFFYGTALSYRQFKRDVDALAGYLQQRAGVKRRDRVLLFMQNSPQFMIAFYAILRADAMVVPVNPMNLTEELRHYVTDSDATVALIGQELLGQVAPLIGAGLDHVVVAAYSDYATEPTELKIPDVVAAPRQPLDVQGAVAWRDALAQELEPDAHLVGPDDLCVMPYTSGITGKPKGCIHTHRTVMSTTVIGGAWVDMKPESVVLGSLPLFHVSGMQCSMNQPIYCGATIVLMTRWDRDTAAELIQRHRIEGWTNIATMAIDFLANPKLAQYDLSSMKHIGFPAQWDPKLGIHVT